MSIRLLLPLNRFIISIWLRITQYVLGQQRKASLVRSSVLVGLVCAASLIMFPYVSTLLGLPFTDIQALATTISLGDFTIFVCYLLVMLLITRLISSRFLVSSIWIGSCAIWLLMFGGTYRGLGIAGTSSVIIYYLIVAASEEGLKFLSAMHITQKHIFSATDIILFTLLVSLGFAFFENLVYVREYIRPQQSVLTQLGSGSALLVRRGLVGFLVHMLFTGLIALTLLKMGKKGLVLAFFLGVNLHMSYNLFLYYDWAFVIVFYLLGGYFFLSYLFYNAHSLYISENNYTTRH